MISNEKEIFQVLTLTHLVESLFLLNLFGFLGKRKIKREQFIVSNYISYKLMSIIFPSGELM